MTAEWRRVGKQRVGGWSHRLQSPRPLSVLLLASLLLTQIPVASAHGGADSSGLTQIHGLVLSLGGVVVLGSAILLKRTDRISPTVALYGVFLGIVVTAVGAILFEGLSPDPTYSARSMPFPRTWYQPLALMAGLLITVGSFVIGWLRWPSRPRYTFLGVDVEDVDIDAVIRENEVVLPAISTEGARSLTKRLCEEAELNVEGEYLKPHGARRGLGDELYRTNPTDAQAALRHSSIAITNESYSHIEAGEISDVIDSTRNGEEER